MFQTPILFLIFNRPEPTFQVFNVIKQLKPKYLFIAADGPRANREGEDILCKKTRSIINQIDWDCELKTLFRDTNLGCGKAPAAAIDWFFDNVQQGIILEDDCLPQISFFHFCEELLDRYKYDERVGMIAGNNYTIPAFHNYNYSYVYSKYVSCWGWATWKRAWKYYDFNMQLYLNERENIENLLSNSFVVLEKNKRTNDFNAIVKDKRVDIWDFQWLFTCLTQNMLTIIPATNLIKNIGFGEDATHTKLQHAKIATLNSDEISFPLRHPSYMIRSELYETLLMKEVRKEMKITILQKTKNKIKKSFNLK